MVRETEKRVEGSLTGLANEFGSDKGTVGPAREWRAHNYTDLYEAYLWRLRDEPIRLLEIGLGVTGAAWRADIARGRNMDGGASLKMWYAFLRKAEIIGVDINPATHLDNDRISTFVVDQGDGGQLRTFARSIGQDGFDVIVDDGSHRPDHQQLTFSVLFPLLRSGGFYFIEDLMDNGLGDRDRGRYSAKSVRSTRQVLKGWVESGAFAGPHAMGERSDRLAHDIAGISFHVPEFRTHHNKWRSPHAWKRPTRLLRPTVGFRPDTETLCVIHRR
jgi:hypothetical protein